MCILRGSNFSDSFVTVIGNQTTFRSLVFAHSVLTLQVVTLVLSEVNSVCRIHSRIQPYSSDEYVHMLKIFNGVALYACGELDGHID